MCQVDVLDSEEASQLDQNTEDNSLVLVGEGGIVDTDELEEALGGGESLVDVDLDGDGVHVVSVLVDGTHVDGVLVNKVEELDEEETISHVEENIFGVGVDRETLRYFGIFVIFELGVDHERHGGDLFILDERVTTASTFHLSAFFALMGNLFQGLGGRLSTLVPHAVHINEFIPGDFAIGVGINLCDDVGDLIVGDVSEAERDKELLELLLVHLTGIVGVKGLEATDHAEGLFGAEAVLDLLCVRYFV